jgi:hypothetical protein
VAQCNRHGSSRRAIAVSVFDNADAGWLHLRLCEMPTCTGVPITLGSIRLKTTPGFHRLLDHVHTGVVSCWYATVNQSSACTQYAVGCPLLPKAEQLAALLGAVVSK